MVIIVAVLLGANAKSDFLWPIDMAFGSFGVKTLEYLTLPIDGPHPSGKDLTYSVEFDSIRTLRTSDDPTLDQGAWATDLKAANWPEVIKVCSKLLRDTTKDLRLVAWMTEALVHTQGYYGLAQGYDLLAKLIEQYWDTIYPEAEDGDYEQRMSSLVWLLSQSVRWVNTIAIVGSERGGYSLMDFTVARSQRSADTRSPNLEQLEQARLATPKDFYQKLWDDVNAATAALANLREVAQRLSADQSPSFSATADALQSAVSTIQRFAEDAGVASQPKEMDATSASSMPAERADQNLVFTGSDGPLEISSRQEALAMLRKVAEYFREAEPHSPAAYLAEQAAKWGGMTLHEWLPLVLRDEGSLTRLQEVLGVSKSKAS